LDSESAQEKKAAVPAIYVYRPESDRRLTEIIAADNFKGWAGEVVHGFATSGTGRIYAALAFKEDGEIGYVCRLIRRRTAAENRHSVFLSEFDLITTAQSFLLKQSISLASYNRGGTPIENYGRLTPGENKKFFANVDQHDPALSEILRKKAKLDDRMLSGLSHHQREILGLERDALGLALDIAFKNREDLIVPAKVVQPDTFQAMLLTKGITEDEVIFHDKGRFPGLKKLRDDNPRISQFEHNNSVLQVIHANRNDLEHTLGVDLIYVSNYFKSFVGVQYKMMKGQSPNSVFSPDDGFNKQLPLMAKILNEVRALDERANQINYRLNDIPFYFKFVSRLVTNFVDDKLCRGMYLPIDLVQVLREGSPPQRIGEKYNTRHLSNSDFANLVRQGWIGSKENQRAAIERLVEIALSSGRSVTIAIETSDKPPLPDEEQVVG
jgi:hypothetical protein